ncbi:MAG: dihydromonapterin reductase [Oceanococcaceae bacterium]
MKSGHLLITGVGRRAGLHLARCFTARGQPVIGTFRSVSPGIEELRSAGVELYCCDFHRPADVDRLIRSVRSAHQDLRAVIHNASQWMRDGDGSSDVDTIEAMMRVHVNVPYVLNRALAPLLRAAPKKSADIIHVGDYVSSRGSAKHMAYAASKAAQDNLTLSFAQQLAPHVKVNSIAPALLLFNEDDDAEYRAKACAKSLMQREGGFDELQQAVDYLMNSRYVTGRILPLDGGRHLR